jgi:hypothetical protein
LLFLHMRTNSVTGASSGITCVRITAANAIQNTAAVRESIKTAVPAERSRLRSFSLDVANGCIVVSPRNLSRDGPQDFSMRRLKALIIGAAMIVMPQLSGQVRFEAASVKRGSPFAGRPDFYIMTGGPGTADPGRFTATGVPLLSLILRAYGLNPFQVASAQSLESDRYNIVAKVPSNTSPAELN